jgi:hypothetical protein
MYINKLGLEFRNFCIHQLFSFLKGISIVNINKIETYNNNIG